jgi:hypothetical protein
LLKSRYVLKRDPGSNVQTEQLRTKQMQITETIARKVIETVDKGLTRGLGNPSPGNMCVEAAVCYALGLPHGDDPACVSRALRSLKICLNDSNWSSNKARAKGMRRLAVAQLGSAGELDEKEFRRRVVDLAIRKSVTDALRSASSVCKDNYKRQAMLDAAVRCEKEGTQEAVIAGKTAANANANAAAAYAADAADAAADAAAANANANAAAAYATAAANAAANANAYAKNAVRDKSLADYAECVVQILIEMKAPGCQWLPLTEI